MKTHVRKTSLETHRTNATDGTYDRTTKIILAYIEGHSGCLQTEISDNTGLRINQVSGRCSELKDRGMIYFGDIVETKKGHYAYRMHIISERYDPINVTIDDEGQYRFA